MQKKKKHNKNGLAQSHMWIIWGLPVFVVDSGEKKNYEIQLSMEKRNGEFAILLSNHL